MQDKDIRRLFQKAEIQVCPEQKRILKMYEYLQNEIDKNENKKQRKRTEISSGCDWPSGSLLLCSVGKCISLY